MKSLQQAPKSVLRYWGLKSAPAFDFVSAFFNDEGFEGPTTWREVALVPYEKLLGPTIKVTVSVSVHSDNNGYAAFDCGAVILSKSIHDLRRAAGEHDPPRKGATRGFTSCLAIRLAHLKWCQHPSEINPSWAMSLDDDTSIPNARVFIEDFKTLMSPILGGLKTDEDLKALLRWASTRSRPDWVKSDGPYILEKWPG